MRACHHPPDCRPELHVALSAFDYVLTLQDEVVYIWQRKFSPASVLLIMNRYGVLLYSIIDVYSIYPRGLKVCILHGFFSINLPNQYHRGLRLYRSTVNGSPTHLSCRNSFAFVSTFMLMLMVLFGCLSCHLHKCLDRSEIRSVFSALRAYALSRRSLLLFTAVLILNLVPVALSILSISSIRPSPNKLTTSSRLYPPPRA